MSLSEIHRQGAARLAHYREVMNDPGLKEVLVLKSDSAPHSVFLDSLNSLEDVPEPLPVIPHKGTAS